MSTKQMVTSDQSLLLALNAAAKAMNKSESAVMKDALRHFLTEFDFILPHPADMQAVPVVNGAQTK